MTPYPLVSTRWLADQLTAPTDGRKVIPVDASWHMPDSTRNARAEYESAHIPGAVFFDIDGTAHPASPLPHTLPNAAQFTASANALGISNDDILVIYDNSDVRSAARAWWTFRVMGHKDVYVLDGGLGKWRLEGRPVTAEATVCAKGNFKPRFVPDICRSQDDVLMNLKSRREQVLDARAAARFEGSVPEPRAGVASGHIPGSRNLPFATLFAADGTLKDAEELKARIAAAGIDMAKPVITTCGSGITACVLKLAFCTLGKEDVAVYDGSWTDWGSAPGLPIETGPACPA
ncbi:MAG: 3-mercaptopyruvate sulfurtransferase [Alphaproteobacteria bacterium]|nr:MAG: 3-mercaptopyruvate sulfurtransferase [Alphaproteobacteria bacterium]